MYDLVAQMHAKFNIPRDDSAVNLLFRQTAMIEEIAEFGAACLKGDRHEQLDALVDLTVFAFGTAVQLGFSQSQFEGAFAEVMRANLAKELGTGKRGYSLDLVKPPDWKAPDLTPFLSENIMEDTGALPKPGPFLRRLLTFFNFFSATK